MGYFKRILFFVKPYLRRFYLATISNILYAIFNILSVVSFLPVLSILFKTENTVKVKPTYTGIYSLFDYLKETFYYQITQQIQNKGVINTLLLICGVSLILFFFKNIFYFLGSYQMAFLSNGVVKDIRNIIYKKVISLPIGYFSEQRKGDLLSRVTSDVQIIEGSFISSFGSIVREPFIIIITLIMMFSMSYKLTLFVFIMLPISGIIISYISKKLKATSLKAQQESGTFLSFLEETLSGLKVIKGFTAEGFFISKFFSSTDRLSKLNTEVTHRQKLASPLSEFLGVLTVIGILLYGGNLVLSNNSNLDAPTFFTYIGLFYSILQPAKSISAIITNVQKGDASAKRIYEILDTPISIYNAKDAIIKKSFDSKIVFDNISFKYESDYVLKDFYLEIPKGKMVALVGQSGSGKSTLANLLMRFYDVNKGNILIDNIDIKNIDKQSLRKLMGIVTQDSILFNDNIENNIELGTKNISKNKIIEAAKIANAHEFIKDLPQNYKTNIGDSGNKLSGGQKQRLSIARAVLKNPPIMILDEATSALDTESEKLVQEALEKMMENRTSLVIAHRLSTIQKADLIVVMKKGKIVEQGKHEELLSKNGEYAKLVELQTI